MSDAPDSNAGNSRTLSGDASSSPSASVPQRGTFRLLRVVLTAVSIVAIGGIAAGAAWYIANIEPSLHPVRGFVFLDGKPMVGGAVISDHTGGWPGALAAIGEDGRFEFTTNGARGAYEGKHKISFTLMDGGFPPTSLLPAKYVDPVNAPFTIEVNNSTADEDQRFELTGKPKTEASPAKASIPPEFPGTNKKN